MSMIKVDSLTFSYPTSHDNIFENVSFQIDTDWKLGFVGRNGRGKTTFLNLLQGKLEYSGKIHSSVQFDYFPYHVDDKTKTASEIFMDIAPLAEEWELIRELSYLHVEADALYRPFETLSSGEQTKILLAALFCNEGHFLLIDEPTNHLDLLAREMVADYLKRKNGFILISHDRSFLDACVDHILSINRANIEVQAGNYTSWFNNFERRQEFEISKNENLKRDIKRLSKSATQKGKWSSKAEEGKFGNGPVDRGFVSHKASKMMKRSKSIEARQQRAIEEKEGLLQNLEKSESLKIHPERYHKDLILEVFDLTIHYEGKDIEINQAFNVRQGDRLFIDGKNGSGKSSLLKLIAEGRDNYSGTLRLGSGIKVSYVPQDTAGLKGTLSDFAEDAGIDETLFKTILRKMDFDRIQFEKNISEFSSGQKKKVLIARSLCERAHIYVWDEPLNYIDIYSRIQIENIIKEFEPTMILVEHDKTFREAIGTKVIAL